jgi:hypothetical protein
MHQDGAVSLLTDIQAAATDPSHSLSDLLRKCQILAIRLRHEPFKTWVGRELNGYPNEVTPPPYRTSLRGDIKADLSGPFGSGGKNVPVPISLFPTEVRDQATRFDFYQAVATLESTVADAKAGGHATIQSMFPVEISARMEIWQGYQTMGMWLEVPIAAVVGVLDQVRSRALEFVLEIEAENPEAGATATATSQPPVPLARADAIFNTVIYGGHVAIGPKAMVNVTPGDLASLMAYLEGQGVEAADRNELAAALKADKGRLGPRVKAWLGEMAVTAARAGGRVGEGAAGGLIAAAVARFLGLA